MYSGVLTYRFVQECPSTSPRLLYLLSDSCYRLVLSAFAVAEQCHCSVSFAVIFI